MSTLVATWMLILGALLQLSAGEDPIEVQVPIGVARDIDVAELVARLSNATGLAVARPSGELRLPIVGLAGGLTRPMRTDSLGPHAPLSGASQPTAGHARRLEPWPDSSGCPRMRDQTEA
jgi:hypothetical protein